VDISRVAAVVTDGRESAALGEHATDLAAILAELLDARDRIARAVEAWDALAEFVDFFGDRIHELPTHHYLEADRLRDAAYAALDATREDK
jgi:hypothetical protein